MKRQQEVTKKKCGCREQCDHQRVFTAKDAAKGHRTKKSGQSEWFVGYKKHTLRILFMDQPPLWSIPAVTIVKPANAGDGDVLSAMVVFWPPYLPAPIIVADMGYLQAERKKQLREQYNISLITRVRSSMKPPQDFGLEPDGCPTCFWGQRLHHELFDWEKQKHLYLKPDDGQDCCQCPFSYCCPQEFWFSPEIHETYLGVWPLHTKLAQKLLQYARPFAEPAFSEDKNRFMLKSLFINSLSLAEFASLMVDSTKLLTTLLHLKKIRGKRLKKISRQLLNQLKLPLF